MSDIYKIKKSDFIEIKRNGYDRNIVDLKLENQEVDCYYGLNKIIVTMEDIKHLINNGFWYFEDGEYATVIGLKKEARE